MVRRGVVVEVAAALAYMSGYRSIQKKIRSQAFDEEAPPTNMLSIYLHNHNTYPILVLSFITRRRRSSQGTHTLIKLLRLYPLMLSRNKE